MIRRALIAVAAIAVAIFTLVGVNRDLTTEPSIDAGGVTRIDGSEMAITVDCRALTTGWADNHGSVDWPVQWNDLYFSLNQEEIDAMVESRGLKPNGDAAENALYEEFAETVHQNAAKACDLERQNQQAKLAQTATTGLVGLILVGIAAIITLPRPRNVTPGSSLVAAGNDD